MDKLKKYFILPLLFLLIYLPIFFKGTAFLKPYWDITMIFSAAQSMISRSKLDWVISNLWNQQGSPIFFSEWLSLDMPLTYMVIAAESLFFSSEFWIAIFSVLNIFLVFSTGIFILKFSKGKHIYIYWYLVFLFLYYTTFNIYYESIAFFYIILGLYFLSRVSLWARLIGAFFIMFFSCLKLNFAPIGLGIILSILVEPRNRTFIFIICLILLAAFCAIPYIDIYSRIWILTGYSSSVYWLPKLSEMDIIINEKLISNLGNNYSIQNNFINARFSSNFKPIIDYIATGGSMNSAYFSAPVWNFSWYLLIILFCYFWLQKVFKWPHILWWILSSLSIFYFLSWNPRYVFLYPLVYLLFLVFLFKNLQNTKSRLVMIISFFVFFIISFGNFYSKEDKSLLNYKNMLNSRKAYLGWKGLELVLESVPSGSRVFSPFFRPISFLSDVRVFWTPYITLTQSETKIFESLKITWTDYILLNSHQFVSEYTYFTWPEDILIGSAFYDFLSNSKYLKIVQTLWKNNDQYLLYKLK